MGWVLVDVAIVVVALVALAALILAVVRRALDLRREVARAQDRLAPGITALRTELDRSGGPLD